jgi:hypothetical protein
MGLFYLRSNEMQTVGTIVSTTTVTLNGPGWDTVFGKGKTVYTIFCDGTRKELQGCIVNPGEDLLKAIMRTIKELGGVGFEIDWEANNPNAAYDRAMSIVGRR